MIQVLRIAVHLAVVAQRGDEHAPLFVPVVPGDRVVLAHALDRLPGPDLRRVVARLVHAQHRVDLHLIRIGRDVELVAPDPARGQAEGGGEVLVDDRDHTRLQLRVRADRAAHHLFVPDPVVRRRDRGAVHDDRVAPAAHVRLELRALRRVQLFARRVQEHHGRVLRQVALEHLRLVGVGEFERVQLGHALQAVPRDRDVLVVVFAGHGQDQQLELVLGHAVRCRCQQQRCAQRPGDAFHIGVLN